MNRRETALLLLALSIAPRTVGAQTPAKPARVGYLTLGDSESVAHLIAALRQRLRELGHVEGKNLVLEIRWGMGDAARVPALARKLVASNPDVVVTGSSLVALALRRATSTVPIVVAGGDVVGTGLVKNLARPEGNITGVSPQQVQIIGSKLIELAMAVNPKDGPVAVMGNPGEPLTASVLAELQGSAKNAGVQLFTINVQSPSEIDQAFVRMTKERAKTVVVVSGSFFMVHRQQIAESALRNGIASVSGRREYVDAGGLISYGSDLAEGYRLAANYIDRILKGAKPADLPVQQPTKFELVVNLRTAKAIGVVVPRDVLMRADFTIQ